MALPVMTVEQRAKALVKAAEGRSSLSGAGGGMPGRHGWPGLRSAGVITRNSFARRGILVKRPVW